MPMIAWPRRKPPKDRATLTSRRRASSLYCGGTSRKPEARRRARVGVAVQVGEERPALLCEVDVDEPEVVEALLPWREDPGQVHPEAGHTGDEVGDRARQGAGDRDGEDDQPAEQEDVDDEHGPGPGQERDRGDAGDERRQDEGEEPGQEEDEDGG